MSKVIKSNKILFIVLGLFVCIGLLFLAHLTKVSVPKTGSQDSIAIFFLVCAGIGLLYYRFKSKNTPISKPVEPPVIPTHSTITFGSIHGIPTIPTVQLYQSCQRPVYILSTNCTKTPNCTKTSKKELYQLYQLPNS